MSIGCSHTNHAQNRMLAGYSPLSMGIVAHLDAQNNTSTENIFAEDRLIPTNGKVIVQYKVDDNDQLQPYKLFKPTPESGYDPALWAKERTNLAKHQKLFNLVANLFRKKDRPGIQIFEIFDSKGIGYIGHMGPKFSNSLKIFRLGMAFDTFDDERNYCYKILDSPFIICTMIHELGHYLTMNKDQAYLVGETKIYKDDSIMKKNQSIPDNYYSRKKCHALSRFVDDYGDLNLGMHHDALCETLVKNYLTGYNEARANTYYKTRAYSQSKKYISSYAKTDHYEDLAETFVYFVLDDKRPEPNVSILGDKVLLFYENKKFVKIRKSIRKNLKKLGIRPKMSRDELKKVFNDLQTPKQADSKTKFLSIFQRK